MSDLSVIGRWKLRIGTEPGVTKRMAAFNSRGSCRMRAATILWSTRLGAILGDEESAPKLLRQQ
jgi:hypothetical protein